MKIRKLNSSDRPAIEEVLRSDNIFTEDEVSVALELVDDAIKAEGASPDYWFQLAVADENPGTVMGYICYGPTPMTDSTFDLYWIVTHKDHRGKRVAKTLVEHMEKDISQRGGGSVRVETSQKEAYGAARGLYDSCNYPESARFPDFYRKGDDLVVFYKRI